MMIIGLKPYRSSHRRCSVRKSVLRNSAKFEGKHLCQSLCFSKVAGQRVDTLLKQTVAQVFSCETCEISKKTFFFYLWVFNMKISGIVLRRFAKSEIRIYIQKKKITIFRICEVGKEKK